MFEEISHEKLRKLLNRLETLEQQAESNSDDLLEQDLIPIFQELTEFLSPDDIELGLSILKSGTTILRLKIEAIKYYIRLLSQNEMIAHFIENCSDDAILNSIIKISWRTPLYFETMAITYLLQSYKNLVENKKIKSQDLLKKPQELSFSSEKPLQVINSQTEEFQTRLMSYFNEIIPLLPCQLPKLLKSFTNPTDYFAHFSFILHLTQEGLIHYNPNTKEFNMPEKKNPIVKKEDFLGE